MSFKVLTLNLRSYIETCNDLQHKVEADGFVPDIVVGIPTGGNRILDNSFETYPKTSVTLVRPPKGKLKSFLKRILALLPQSVNDRLRIIEAKKLVRRKSHMKNTGIILPHINESVKKILIIDDAVDSGATLKAITEAFKDQFPDRDIRTAVITVTGTDTTYMPDYFIYNNQTLIRSPWSVDIK